MAKEINIKTHFFHSIYHCFSPTEGLQCNHGTRNMCRFWNHMKAGQSLLEHLYLHNFQTGCHPARRLVLRRREGCMIVAAAGKRPPNASWITLFPQKRHFMVHHWLCGLCNISSCIDLQTAGVQLSSEDFLFLIWKIIFATTVNKWQYLLRLFESV